MSKVELQDDPRSLLYFDQNVLDYYEKKAKKSGQMLDDVINEVLRQHMEAVNLREEIRRIVREEISVARSGKKKR